MADPALHGIMAEFDTPAGLLAAAQKTRAAGYRNVDAFTPYPMEEVSEAIGFHDRRLSKIVLGGGVTGLLAGYGLQYWVHAITYPVNVAGKPLNSWPQFVPVTFELTILFSAFAAVVGMIVLNGLPMPYHPVFNVPRFVSASRDRFFLLIEATDPKFDRRQTLEFLKTLQARDVSEVEP
jgi:Alternative complex III, ActD subunit